MATRAATPGAADLDRQRRPADRAARRLLRIGPGAGRGRTDDARRAFSTSVVVSGLRCLLTYVVLPFVAPALGLAAGVGPVLGVAIGLVAIASNVLSIRRFWLADHRWRWGYTAVGGAIIVLLVVLLVGDLVALVG